MESHNVIRISEFGITSIGVAARVSVVSITPTFTSSQKCRKSFEKHSTGAQDAEDIGKNKALEPEAQTRCRIHCKKHGSRARGTEFTVKNTVPEPSEQKNENGQG